MSTDASASIAAGAGPASDDLMRALADSVPAAIAYYELLSMQCLFANRQYAQSNGWSVTSIVGKTVREAIGEAAWAAILPHIERVKAGEKVFYVRPLTLR